MPYVPEAPRTNTPTSTDADLATRIREMDEGARADTITIHMLHINSQKVKNMCRSHLPEVATYLINYKGKG